MPNFAKTNSSGTEFFIFKTKKAFIYLRKTFTKTLIHWHFDQKRHIYIKTNTLGYSIGGILSQITLDQLDQLFSNHIIHKNLDLISSKSEFCQWQLIAFFSQKMISTETIYETHNQEPLAILEAFKTCCHHLKGCKYKVLIFGDHNNFY